MQNTQNNDDNRAKYLYIQKTEMRQHPGQRKQNYPRPFIQEYQTGQTVSEIFE